MVRGGQTALADLWVMRVVIVSLCTRWIRLLVMRAELFLRVIIHHVYFRQIQFLVFENIAARLSNDAVHVADACDVLAN